MDISIIWDNTAGRGDWSLSQGDLAAGDDLVAAVLVSLFTDRLAAADVANPGGTADRRGWWADAQTGDPIGSDLWLLYGQPATPALLVRAEQAARAALAWLIDDGVATAVDVVASYPLSGRLGLEITITQPSGTARMRFAWAWATLPS